MEWGRTGTREFETGVDRGVLYLSGQAGVPWTGLTSVDVAPEGGSSKSYYIDGVEVPPRLPAGRVRRHHQRVHLPASILRMRRNEVNPKRADPEPATAKALRILLAIDGRQRPQSRGRIQIHLVYNALAEPSGRSHESATDSVDPTPFSWSVKTKPPIVAGYRRTAHVVIDSQTTEVTVLKAVEDALYGSNSTEPRLPTVSELVEMYDQLFDLVVVDNGDGTFTATGPNSVIQILNDEIWQVTSPNAVNIDDTVFTLTSA